MRLTWIKETLVRNQHRRAMADPCKADSSDDLALSAGALDEADLAQAYVLVGLCHDSVTMDRWRHLVAAGARPSPQVWKTIRDRRGYIHALFAYRMEHDLTLGCTLVVTDILTAGPGWRAALEAIEASARQIASDAGCPSIRVTIHPDREAPGSRELRAVFGALGYADRGPYLSRSFPQGVA